MPLIANTFKEGDEQHARENTEQECGSNPDDQNYSSNNNIQHNFEHNYSEHEHNFPEKRFSEKREGFYDFQHFVPPQEDFQEHFTQTQEDQDDEDMLSRPRPKKLVPDLPQKSKLRASRILDNLTLDLEALGRVKIEDQESLYSNPLDSYLSSEEDGSASGDDYEDVVSDEEGSEKSATLRRHSHEETATAVSFRCMKPQLVEIGHHHSQSTPASYALNSLSQSRLSVSSSSSSPLLTTMPPRTSSRPPANRPLLSVDTFTPPISRPTPTTRPSFLSSDPYPEESPVSMISRNASSSSGTSSPAPLNAKSEKPSSGWGSLRAVSRTLALARKKASIPKMNLAYTNGVVPPKRNSTSPVQTLSAPSTDSISSSESPSTPARRRSQTFNRLMGNSSKEDKRGSDYRGRYAEADWTTFIILGASGSNVPRPKTSAGSSKTSSSKTSALSSKTSAASSKKSAASSKTSAESSPITKTTENSPVEAIIASIPAIHPATTDDSQPPPVLHRRGRSFTASSSSSPISDSRSRSILMSKENMNTLPPSNSTPRMSTTSSYSSYSIPESMTTVSSIYSQPSTYSFQPLSHPPPPAAPAHQQQQIYTHSTSHSTSVPSSVKPESEKQNRRLTTFPDYSRATAIARQPADVHQHRPAISALAGAGTATAPVGNTYHDIMKSVAIVERNGREMKGMVGEKVLRGKSSMAMLVGGLGARRGLATGKGLKA